MTVALRGILAASRRRTVLPPTFRAMSFAHTVGSGVTSLVVPMPAGVAIGDALILVHHQSKSGGTTTNVPAGWTDRGRHTSTNDTFSLFTRVADGTEGANVTVTSAATALHNAGILAYSGAGGIDAVTDFGAAQSANTTPTIPSVTATVANDIIVGVVGKISGSGGTPAAGWTERLDHQSPTSAGLVYAMDIVQVTAGASSTAQPTFVSGSLQWTWAVAVKPA